MGVAEYRSGVQIRREVIVPRAGAGRPLHSGHSHGALLRTKRPRRCEMSQELQGVVRGGEEERTCIASALPAGMWAAFANG